MSNPLEWIPISEKLPSPEETVFVAVRNKNKENGIWLFDTCSHDSMKWATRQNTWEDIVYWAYPTPPVEKK